MSKRRNDTASANGAKQVEDDSKKVALQQFYETEGHFSLVRQVYARVALVACSCSRLLCLRNFRLADLITIANGICGSFSVFMSAKYLVTNDEDYLWSALVFPLAGLLFDFMDGTVARWRNESSMLGQELDSLADLVRVLQAREFCSS